MTVPWSPKTRQVEGRDTESDVLKRLGAQAHAMSGAGRQKADGHTDSHIIEVKDRTGKTRSYRVTEDELAELWALGVREHKEPVLVVEFGTLTAFVFPVREA